MSATILTNDKYSVKNRFKNLNLSSSHAIVFSARKGLKPQIFYDFAEAVKMPEKILTKTSMCNSIY